MTTDIIVVAAARTAVGRLGRALVKSPGFAKARRTTAARRRPAPR
jgi:hypothetical protein